VSYEAANSTKLKLFVIDTKSDLPEFL